MGELIAVLSGKAGTGKTSVCAALATSLVHLGETVLCIDCDVGLRNLDIALGLSDEGTLSFSEVADGTYPLDAATPHPFFPGLQFLTAPMGVAAGDVDFVSFEKLLAQARQQFSYVFLDAPAGIEAGFSLAAQFADRVILVTNADPASIRDAAQAGNVLEKMGKTNVRLVVNRIDRRTAAAMRLTVDDIMDRAGLPLIGVVLEDPDVPMAAATGKSLLRYNKRSATIKAFQRIAKRIQGYPEPIKIR